MYRLLVVDEDPAVCAGLLRALDWRRYGFSSLMSATSYAEAVSKVLDRPPHIALVSVKLGDHWGWDLAAQLRQQGIKTVFAMLSDTSDPMYLRRSMQACAQDFFLKPVAAGELRAFVERVVVNELGGSLPKRGTQPEKVDPVLHVEYQSLSKITNKIILYTRNNYRSSLSLISIAEVFKMSSKYIGRVFLSDTGMRYSDYLVAYRMLEARKLIIGTQNKISVIANMVGYSQLNNFYIHFKRYFGVSPGDLRKDDTNEKETE